MTENRFKEILKRGLGASVSALVRLDGCDCVSKVYGAELADGRKVFAKLSHETTVGRTVAFLKVCPPTRLVSRLLVDPVFEDGEWAFAFEWRPAVRIPVCRMNDRQFDSFRCELQTFYGLLQTAPDVGCVRDGGGLHGEIVAYVRRHPLARFILGPLMAMCAEDLVFPSDEPKAVIHGDFHSGNFGFSGDALEAFYDFDLLRRGSPLEDLAFLMTEEVKRGIGANDFRRLVARSRQLVAESGRPLAAWRVAFNQARLWEAVKLVRRHPDRLRTSLNVARRDRRFVRLMKRLGIDGVK